MKVKLAALLIGFLLLVCSGKIIQAQTNAYASAGLASPAVTSDKDDYAPGEIARITGSGWTLDTQVHVEFKEEPDYPDLHTYEINVDSAGNWKIDFPIEARHIGVKFTVIVDGKTSGFRTQTTFTDANRYVVANGDWNSTATWAATSGGPPGASVPVPGDAVAIENGYEVTVSSPVAAASVSIGGGNDNTTSILKFSSSGILTVGNLALSSNNGKKGFLDMTNGGTLKLTGTFTVSNPAANILFAPGTGTIEYSGAAQTIANTSGSNRLGAFYYNLTLSGTGSKTINSATATNVLSMEGTATVNAAPIYGPAATLRYNTITARSSGPEWISPFTATGGIIIDNTGVITAGSGKNLNSGTTLTIKPGATFNPGTHSHIISGGSSLIVNGTLDFSNDGAMVSGTTGISTLTMGDSGTIKTRDPTGLGPAAAASFSTQTGGTWNHASISTNGSVEYYLNSGVIQAITDRDYNNIVITGSSSTKRWTLSADRTVNGSFTKNATVVLSGTQSISIKGNWSNTGSFNAGSGKVVFNGGSTQTIGGSTATAFNNLSIATGSTVNLSSLNHTASSLTIGSSGTAAGTWGGTGSAATNTNTTFFSPASGKVTVGTATCTPPAAPVAGSNIFTYDGSIKTATVSAGTGETIVWYATASGGATATAPGGTDAGSYSAYAEARNLTSGCVSTSRTLVTLTIAPRAITVTADAGQNKVYGSTDPTFAYTTSETLLPGNTFTGELTREAGENVADGPFTYSLGSLSAGANYSVTLASTNTFTINPKVITVSVIAGQNKVYGSADPTFAYTASETLQNGNNFTGAIAREAGENVADGPFAFSLGTLSAGTNYSLILAGTNTFAVTNRPITITADAKSKTYGDADPALTARVTTGTIVNGDLPTGALCRATGENVGSYAISQDSYTYGSNYDETYVGDNLNIGKRNITITADAKSKTYGDADPALTARVTTGTIVNGDLPTGALCRATGENVGSYAISQDSYTYGSNYDETYVGDNLNIGKRNITITADAKSKTYGDPDPALTARVTTGTIVNGDLPTGALSRATSENVGSYAICQDSYTYGSNYDETYVGDNLNIGKRNITITADAKSKTYGDPDPALTARVTTGTIVNGDLPTGALSRATGENVESYAISQDSYTYGSNYDETYVGDNLNIGKRNITITADAKSKTYGDPDPALTTRVTTGTIVNGDLPTGTLSRATGENVGSYAISQDSYTYGSNYDETYVGDNLNIRKLNITITADAKSKTYGDPDPALTARVTTGSIVDGDLPTGALSRATGENVGSYAISQDSYTYGSNYNETYAGASLTIGQRNITIAADSKSKYCGQTDPPLTYSISSGSVVSTDNFSGALIRSPGENAGIYSINQGSVALNNNYSLTYLPAHLTINEIAIDANANSIPQAITTPIVLKAMVTPAASGIPVRFYIDNVLKGTGLTDASGLASLSIGTLETSVYEVKAIEGFGASESRVFLPVYDPNGGFVTGGGWIDSPAGSYVANTSLTGKANFGFVAKYKKGSTVPEGNTEFQFHVGNLNFNSSAYEDMRLVIAGSKANYKGTGKINGAGNYGFMVSAVDGQVSGGGSIDKFRIKIWDKNNGDLIVYDNNMGKDENDPPATSLAGGSIVIHEVKGGKTASTTPLADNSHNGLDMKIVEPVLEQKIKLGAYPNPFGKLATIAFTLPTDEQVVTLDVYDLKGSRIKRMYEGKAAAQQNLEFEFNGSNLSPGMYLLRLTTPNKVENFKMIMTE